jgi:hypothetical protein
MQMNRSNAGAEPFFWDWLVTFEFLVGDIMRPKSRLEKLEGTEVSWETHAPLAKFYGLNLADYQARVQMSRDVRELIANLEQQVAAAKNDCYRIDRENLTIEQNVAYAIAGDKDYGNDSDLYEGTGRVRKSERKSGLTRKRKTPGGEQG